MGIEGEPDRDATVGHQHEAERINGRQLVHVGPLEIRPGPIPGGTVDRSGLVENAVMAHGCAAQWAGPDRHRASGSRTEPHLPDGIANQIGNAAASSVGGVSQRLQFFVASIDLRLGHMCQFSV